MRGEWTCRFLNIKSKILRHQIVLAEYVIGPVQVNIGWPCLKSDSGAKAKDAVRCSVARGGGEGEGKPVSLWAEALTLSLRRPFGCALHYTPHYKILRQTTITTTRIRWKWRRSTFSRRAIYVHSFLWGEVKHD